MRNREKLLAYALIGALTLSSAGTVNAATSSPVEGKTPVTKNNVTPTVVKGTDTVTANVKKNGTAVITATPKSASKKTVKIGKKITYKKVAYTVTVINGNAFKKCKKATTIILPATIKRINKKAFTGAKKLKKIRINISKNITVKKGAFKGLSTKKMKIVVNKSTTAKQLKKLQKTFKKAGFRGKVVKA